MSEISWLEVKVWLLKDIESIIVLFFDCFGRMKLFITLQVFAISSLNRLYIQSRYFSLVNLFVPITKCLNDFN